MNFPCYTFSENYDDRQKKRYIAFLRQLGTSVDWGEDIWVCDKRIRSAAEQLSHVSIRFTKIPEVYKEQCKYFAIMRLLNGSTVRTVQGNVTSLTPLLKFLSEANGNLPVCACDISIASSFKTYLDASPLVSGTKHNIWSCASNFLGTMNGFDGMKCKNPFHLNPYPSKKKVDSKYIPEDLAKALDTIFMSEDIDLYMRCIYWILRLIPSRISEVVGMKIDCMKPFNGNVVFFIPTWKQNGGYMEPVLRSIHLKEEGMAGHLIGLIREQQLVAAALQSQLPENKQ
ncbi:MAG: tyrosine-type recombinase/integrase, partial [Lacrimispora sphenoides]